MDNTQVSVSVSEIYEIAMKVIPKVMLKLPMVFKQHFDRNDVVNDYILRVIEHGYNKRANRDKNVQSYVFTGLRHTAFNIARKLKSEVNKTEYAILDDIYNPLDHDSEDLVSQFFSKLEYIRDKSEYLNHIESDDTLEAVLRQVRDTRFKHGVWIKFNGKKYPPTMHTALKLIHLGLNRETVAKMMGIHSGTIAQQFKCLPKKRLLKQMLKGW